MLHLLLREEDRRTQSRLSKAKAPVLTRPPGPVLCEAKAPVLTRPPGLVFMRGENAGANQAPGSGVARGENAGANQASGSGHELGENAGDSEPSASKTDAGDAPSFIDEKGESAPDSEEEVASSDEVAKRVEKIMHFVSNVYATDDSNTSKKGVKPYILESFLLGRPIRTPPNSHSVSRPMRSNSPKEAKDD